MLIFQVLFTMIGLTFMLIGYNFQNLKNHDEGTDEMKEKAGIIRSGAKTFLRREYRVIIPVVLCVAVVFTLTQEIFAGLCFLVGSTLVAIAVEIGMRGGAYGNVRTTNAARVTGAISRTLRIATLGGCLSGFSVPAFAVFGAAVLYLLCWFNNPMTISHGLLTVSTPCNAMASRLLAYGLGCSMIAIFNRVAGGTYTKSADISADIVGKSDFGIEEDDPRNVCSIADFIGDLVNDIAGNISDLSESFIATPIACIVITIQNYGDNMAALTVTTRYPFLLIAGGLFSTIVSVMYIILRNRKRHKWVLVAEGEDITEEETKVIDGTLMKRVEYSLEIDDPGAELNKTTAISAIITVLIGLYGAKYLFAGTAVAETFKFGWLSPWAASVLGIVSSVCVGLLTEFYTSTKYRHVKGIVRVSPEGGAFVVSEGMAVGNRSVFLPSLIIAGSILFSFIFCGLYGIAIAAVGMLSFIGTTVTIDAFGPIADNAGGIAESCGLDEEVRKITDELDALGNTTAAVGKGNAIGAAAFSTITMMMAFIGNIPAYNLNEPESIVRLIAGGIVGMAVIRFFISLLTKNTLAAAWKLAAIAKAELEDEDVWNYRRQPDYEKAIESASDTALGYMLIPSLLSAISPIIVGFLFGPITVLGMLFGSTLEAIGEAFFNGNAGGAYDNAKKSIEMGLLVGFEKHSAAHIATIIGDTIGDIMKDVVGVCCDISIKIMATVSTAFCVLFYTYYLFR